MSACAQAENERREIDASVFKRDQEGVWFEEKRDGKNHRRIRICGPLEVLKATRDSQGENWGHLLGWRDPEGREHRWAMERSMLAGDGREIRARLLGGGLYLNPDRVAREALARYLSERPADAKARCVSRTGWHDTPDGPVFVLPDVTFGGSSNEEVVFQNSSSAEHPFRTAGSLEEWQEKVARPCLGNSRLVFALSVALAPPLLRLLDAESGGFHLRGGSSIGKTTALHVAGSAWGGGGLRGYVDTWRATDNGLEAIAVMRSDSLLCIDELSQVDPRAAGATAYMLANCTGKSRANRYGDGRTPASWRLLFLSTGELSLSDKLQEDGRGTVTAGQEVRVVDIPADPGVGLGIFEQVPSDTDAERFARSLKEASRRYYGTAARAMVQRLLDELDICTVLARQKVEDFLDEVVPKGADGQVFRVARRFGLAAAAGELAIHMGVLPWPKGSAQEAATVCFHAWLRERGGSGSAELSGALARVRFFLEQGSASRFEMWNRQDREREAKVINRAGFRKQDGSDGWLFYILPEVWKKEVCRGLDAKRIARAFVQLGVIIPDTTGNRTAQKHRVDGLGQSRLYCVSWDALDTATGGRVPEVDQHAEPGPAESGVPGGTAEDVIEDPAD